MNKWTLQGLMLVIASPTFVVPAVAQPANDNCSGAFQAFDGDNLVDTKLSTLDMQVPCARNGPANTGPGVWFTYTAPVTGIRNFTITQFRRTSPTVGSARDSIIAIFDACNGTLLACDDQSGMNNYSKIYHYPVTAGTNYIIWVGNWSPTVSEINKGVGTLNISAPPAPVAVDDCALAAPVSGSTASFTTTGLTNSDAQAWDCDPMWYDGWLAWTPATSGVGVVSACAATGASSLLLSLYESCGSVPLVCNSSFQDPPNANCSPRLCAQVAAGHTYYLRFGTSIDTAAASGDILFEVRPLGAGITIPPGAIPEPGNCDDAPGADVNGGCDIIGENPTASPHTFTMLNLCETRSGTASSRLLPIVPDIYDSYTVDRDWYQFTLDTDQAVTITGESEFLPFTRILVGCPATQIQRGPALSPNCQGVYTLNMTTTTLVAGTYYYYIAPQWNFGTNANDCTHGNRYWFKITGSATTCPTTVTCCRGTTCLSVAAGSCTGTVAGSASVEVSSCGPNSQTAHCCYGDYDHNTVRDIDDIFVYLNAWFGNSPYAKVGGDGTATPVIDDIFLFLNAWFTGCS